MVVSWSFLLGQRSGVRCKHHSEGANFCVLLENFLGVHREEFEIKGGDRQHQKLSLGHHGHWIFCRVVVFHDSL